MHRETLCFQTEILWFKRSGSEEIRRRILLFFLNHSPRQHVRSIWRCTRQKEHCPTWMIFVRRLIEPSSVVDVYVPVYDGRVGRFPPSLSSDFSGLAPSARGFCPALNRTYIGICQGPVVRCTLLTSRLMQYF